MANVEIDLYPGGYKHHRPSLFGLDDATPHVKAESQQGMEHCVTMWDVHFQSGHVTVIAAMAAVGCRMWLVVGSFSSGKN
jgi:hypothetical protein